MSCKFHFLSVPCVCPPNKKIQLTERNGCMGGPIYMLKIVESLKNSSVSSHLACWQFPILSLTLCLHPRNLGVSDLLRSLCANDTMNLGWFKTILWNSKWLFAFVKVNPECRSFFPWIWFSFLCFGSFGFCFWSTSGAVTQDRR